MRYADIHTTMKKRLADGIALPGAWPNVDPPEPMGRPYLEIAFVEADRVSAVMSGEAFREIGTMVVTVVAEQGQGEDSPAAYAEAVSDLFAPPLQMPVVDGLISISQPPIISGGYRDGPDWRVPVRVRYTAHSQ